MEKKARINLKKRFAFQRPYSVRPGYTQEESVNDRKNLWKPEFDFYLEKKGFQTSNNMTIASSTVLTLEQAKAMVCKPF
jgi:hypothetical protein